MINSFKSLTEVHKARIHSASASTIGMQKPPQELELGRALMCALDISSEVINAIWNETLFSSLASTRKRP